MAGGVETSGLAGGSSAQAGFSVPVSGAGFTGSLAVSSFGEIAAALPVVGGVSDFGSFSASSAAGAGADVETGGFSGSLGAGDFEARLRRRTKRPRKAPTRINAPGTAGENQTSLAWKNK